MKDDKCGYFDVLNVDEDKVTNAGLAGAGELCHK